MAIAGFLDRMCLAPRVSRLWLRYTTPAKLYPFLSLDCAPTPSTLAQSKERKGSNFAIWQPCFKGKSNDPVIRMNPDPEGSGGSGGSGGEFGMEFVLTFIVVYAFCASRDAR